MRHVLPLSLAAGLLLSSTGAAAQSNAAPEASKPEKPLTDQTVSAGDVATTPISDLNLKKNKIPPLLLAAQERPYDATGLRTCAQIASAVGELDAVLGDDFDVPQTGKSKMSAGRIAQAAVGEFIPFRGLIREISGANASQRATQVAIYAGSVRRAFLKGVGQQKGCRYPARPATPDVVAARAAMLAQPAKVPAKR